MVSFPPVDATSLLSLSVTWRVPFIPAYGVEFVLSFSLFLCFPFSLTSIQKHLITYVLGTVC